MRNRRVPRLVAAVLAAPLGACASAASTPSTAASTPSIAAPAPFSFDTPRAPSPLVGRWLLLGPFDVAEGAPATPQFIDEESAAPSKGESAAGCVWTEYRPGGRGVDLRAVLRGGENSAAYAFTYLVADADVDAVVWLGADNQSRVLLDGRVIHETRARSWYVPDTFGLAVRLTRGVHRLLVRVENCGGPHRFWLRLTDPRGLCAAGLRPSLAAGDPQLTENAQVDPAGFSLADLLVHLPADADRRIGFDTESSVARVAVTKGYGDECPMWRGTGGPEYGPHPGRVGVFGMHAAAPETPERAFWKVRVPAEPSILRLVASPEAYAAPCRADAILRVGVFDGELRWIKEVQLGPDPIPSASAWVTIAEALPRSTEGRDVLVVIEAASGGALPWHYEGVWLDEIEVVPAK